MLLLWYMCFLVSFVSFIIGIVKLSPSLLVISSITSIPIAYYFFGTNHAVQYIVFTPIVILLLAMLVWFFPRKAKPKNVLEL